MVGEDNEKALIHGQYYVSKAIGTLGPSIRGKSPIFNKKGEIIGVVSVGYLEEKVKKIVAEYHNQLLNYLYITLFVGLLVAVLLSTKLKRSLLGYEPQELSRLFLEKKAILNSVKEAIIATGTLEGNSILKASYIPTEATLLENDNVETSGLGGIYPKGIHIGTIKQIVNTKNNIDRYAYIETAVDFSKLQTVLVITNE